MSDAVRLIPADALRRVDTICRAARARSDSLSARSDTLSVLLAPLVRKDTLTADALLRARNEQLRLEEERAAVQREAARQVRALLIESAAAEVQTVASSHYRLDGVRAGEYAVWAEGTMDRDRPVDWVAPVTVRPGETVVRHLDSGAQGTTGLYCGFTVRAYWLR
jgi:hypothetical protein